MEPFTIVCTTCKARLKVRDESAVGDILACPKCGSMVFVSPPDATPPDGSSSESLLPSRSASSSSSTLPAPAPSPDPNPSGFRSTATEFVLPAAAPSYNAYGSTFEDSGSLAPHAPPNEPPAAGAVSGNSDSAEPGPWKVPRKLPPAPKPAPSGRQSPGPSGAASIPGDPPAPPPLLPDETWVSPKVRTLRQALLAAGAGAVGVILAVALLGLWVSRGQSDWQVAEQSRAPLDAPEPPMPPAEALNDALAPSEPPDAPALSLPDDERPIHDASQDVSTPAVPVAPAPASVATSPDQEEPLPPTPSPAAPPDLADASPDKEPDEDPDAPADGFNLLTRSAAVAAAPRPAAFDLFGPTQVPAVEESAPANGQDPANPPPAAKDDQALPRPPARDVDAAARLKDRIVQIEFASMPLVDLTRLLSKMSTVPISFDTDALAQRRLSPRAAAQVRLANTALAGVLSAIVEPLGLAWRVEDEQVVIGFREHADGRLRRAVYQVSDLTQGNTERLTNLIELVQEFVAPDSWTDAGGAAVIEPQGDALAVEQTEAGHFAVLRLCEELRVANGLPPRSGYPAPAFDPQAWQIDLRGRLRQPVSGNFSRPTPLADVLDHLGKQAQVTALVDWRSTAEEGWPLDSLAQVVADRQPLGEALEALLAPMDLAWRAVDGQTIQVVSKQDALKAQVLHAYPAAKALKAHGGDPTRFLDRIEQALGDAVSSGAIRLIDGAVVLLAPQSAHERLIEALADEAQPIAARSK